VILRDSWTEAWRHMIEIPRSPDLVLFTLIQPVMFVLLFVYVFGGSLVVPGYDDYKQYVIPGVFAQTALWGSAFTGVGVAEDMSKGLIDRLRSLPIHPSSVLLGRTISDFVRNIVTFVVMFAMALAVGFRFGGSVLDTVLATLLLFVFAYAFSWVQAFMGLSVSSVEAANSAGYVWMFPLTFVSSAYVDPESMPSWLTPIAEANPFTVLTDAGRALYNGQDPGSDVWLALLWAAGITLVFSTLSIRKFRSSSR
jgi:ABC-2 type transport system permease protein